MPVAFKGSGERDIVRAFQADISANRLPAITIVIGGYLQVDVCG